MLLLLASEDARRYLIMGATDTATAFLSLFDGHPNVPGSTKKGVKITYL